VLTLGYLKSKLNERLILSFGLTSRPIGFLLIRLRLFSYGFLIEFIDLNSELESYSNQVIFGIVEHKEVPSEY